MLSKSGKFRFLLSEILHLSRAGKTFIGVTHVWGWVIRVTLGAVLNTYKGIAPPPHPHCPRPVQILSIVCALFGSLKQSRTSIDKTCAHWTARLSNLISGSGPFR